MPADRRGFPRIAAPLLCRPIGTPFFSPRRAVDVSPGGIRTYSDEEHAPGDRLELELFLDGEPPLLCTAEIVWIEELARDAPARFDVGLKFVAITPRDRERLTALMVHD